MHFEKHRRGWVDRTNYGTDANTHGVGIGMHAEWQWRRGAQQVHNGLGHGRPNDDRRRARIVCGRGNGNERTRRRKAGRAVEDVQDVTDLQKHVEEGEANSEASGRLNDALAA